MKFTPFPELKSERIFLRNIIAFDCEEILFLRSNKTINKFIERPESRQTKNLSDAIKFINELNQFVEHDISIAWGITFEDSPKIIGTICLWNFSQNNKTAEVGYDLDPKFHRKGIMSEALKMIIEFGFKKLKLDKIEAFTHIANESSKILLEKNGFYLQAERKDSDNESNVIYELENTSRLQ